MERRFILYFLIVGNIIAYGFAQDPCELSCAGVNPGDKIPDPFDCARYYICGPDETISDTSYLCDPPNYFKPGADCTATECVQPCGSCTLTCNNPGVVIAVADPFDCTVFYECGIGGRGDPQTCPGHLPYYNSSTYTCSSDPNVCCRPSCTVNCSVPGSYVPDPTDCTKYYFCTTGPPFPSFSCGDNEVFDIGNGACSPTAECIILCPGGSPLPELPGKPTTPIVIDSTPTAIKTTPIVTDTTPITIETTTTVAGGSTPSPAPETTTTPGTDSCLSEFLCPTNGFFPACQTCDPRYFYCESGGNPGVLNACSGGRQFNPVPGHPFCLEPDMCPYYPYVSRQ